MARMYFAKTVKYLGVKYPPHTQFDVVDEDVESLREAGGWVVEDAPKSQPVEVIEPVEPKAEIDDSVVVETVPKEQPTVEPVVEQPAVEPVVDEPKVEAPKKAETKSTSTKKVA